VCNRPWLRDGGKTLAPEGSVQMRSGSKETRFPCGYLLKLPTDLLIAAVTLARRLTRESWSPRVGPLGSVTNSRRRAPLFCSPYAPNTRFVLPFERVTISGRF